MVYVLVVIVSYADPNSYVRVRIIQKKKDNNISDTKYRIITCTNINFILLLSFDKKQASRDFRTI